MDRCASIRPLCYGIAFNHDDSTCWFKNETFSFQRSAAEDSTEMHLAVARKDDLQGFDTTCPYDNGTVHQENGANFTIHCNQDILGGDYSPSRTLHGVYHADSLSQCMRLCTEAHSLCTGVSWNPDMKKGYGNCYPKFNFTQGYIASGESNRNEVMHSAVIKLPQIDDECQDDQALSANNGTGFILSCDTDHSFNDLTQYHTTNLEDCINTCDQYTPSPCVGVIFDTRMTYGFQNCWLKSGIGTPNNAPGYIFAMKRGTLSNGNGTDNEDNGNNDDNDDDDNGGGGLPGSASAGIVVGVVGAVALLAAAVFFFWRKRRNQDLSASTAASEKLAGTHSGVAYNPLQDVNVKAGYSYNQGAYGSTSSSPAGAGTGAYMQNDSYGGYQRDPKYSSNPGEGPSYEMSTQRARQELPGTQVEIHELPEALNDSNNLTDRGIDNGSRHSGGNVL